uniref:Bcl-x interacting BH3 domain-containing protein n=1 Tax=Melopsittacus undulatus TaxID=13146 RepID=A0A8V5FZD5_MELUD
DLKAPPAPTPPELWIAQELRRIGDEFNASSCPRRVTHIPHSHCFTSRMHGILYGKHGILYGNVQLLKGRPWLAPVA